MAQEPFSPEVTQDDRLWAALGYPIGIIAIIVLLMDDKKNRPFIRYHAIQALILNLALYILMTVLTVTVVGAICAPFVWLVSLWPAFDAYKGNWTELPVITKFMKNQGWA